MIIYVRTQGARIIKEGRHLLVKKEQTTYHTLFTYKLDQLVIFGSVEISPAALTQLMRHNIDTVFLSANGRYKGRIATPEAKNVFLRKRQYTLLDDPGFNLRIARSLVAGKLANMATVLMRIKRSKNDRTAGYSAEGIQDLMKKLESAENVNSIRGYEGRGTALYFEGFCRGFLIDMGFRHRVRRPPTDPVNAVLSLLYTFLMNRVYAAVRIAGLDPYPGFLHTIDYGRYSLVLDLMEEFRPIIVDTLTLSLFNLKILQHDDFLVQPPAAMPEYADTVPAGIPDVTQDPIGRMSFDGTGEDLFDMPEQRVDDAPVQTGEPTGKFPVKLKPEAFTRVIEAFERKLTTDFYYPPADAKLSYGEAIVYQAGHFRKVIEGEVEVYQPILLK